MAISRESATIGAAVILVCLGLVAWLFRRRWDDRTIVPVLLLGFPGIYLCLLPGLDDAPKWLYVPGVLLVVLSTLVQLIMMYTYAAKSKARPPDKDNPG